MKRMWSTSLTACVVTGALAVTACAGALAIGALDVCVTVSPSTIVLGLDKGSEVTVHTDIPLSVVDRSSVALSGVTPYTTFADSCGNLVAKFRQEEIESIVAPPQATLTLTGMTEDGESFSGSDTVRVIVDPSPGK